MILKCRYYFANVSATKAYKFIRLEFQSPMGPLEILAPAGSLLALLTNILDSFRIFVKVDNKELPKRVK